MPPEPEAIAKAELRLRHLTRRTARPEADRAAAAADDDRRGRGGGYCDRALVRARPDAVLVALVSDDELVEALPAEPHDRPVTAVVTPSRGWQAVPAGR